MLPTECSLRARQQWQTLRQHLPDRFDQWLDALETPWPQPAPTVSQVSEPIRTLRHQLTGGVAETIVHHTQATEQRRTSLPCPTCQHLLTVRGPVRRRVETMLGGVELARPYFSCRPCPRGHSPLDDVLGVHTGGLQLDVQQAAVDVAIALPCDTAARQCERLSGMGVSSERLHTFTNRVADGLSGWEGAPSSEEIARRPVLVLGVDGAYVPSRPERAWGHRPGRARPRARRARGQHEWREATGVRLYLLDDDRLVHILSWHQVQTAHDLGEAVRQGKEAVRLCVVCDGAEWIWTHIEALFPQACPFLD